MSSPVSINDVINAVAALPQAAQDQKISQVYSVAPEQKLSQPQDSPQDHNIPLASTPATPDHQDTVSISQTAQQLAQSTTALVQELHDEGVPIEIIAAELDSTPASVQSYLTVASLAASA